MTSFLSEVLEKLVAQIAEQFGLSVKVNPILLGCQLWSVGSQKTKFQNNVRRPA